RKKRIAARLVAIETEPVTVAVAAEKTRDYPEISLVQGDAMALPFRAASFDFVLASQLLNHFSEDNVVTLLRTWSKVARRAIIVSDLVRNPLDYYGIRAITRLFTRNVMTLTDAPLSVWRAFTMAEWRELFRRADVGRFEIFWVFPFRVMALIRFEADHAEIRRSRCRGGPGGISRSHFSRAQRLFGCASGQATVPTGKTLRRFCQSC